MNETTLTLMGTVLRFQYVVHNDHYVEWSLHPESKGPSPSLLETLLRIHYCTFIESQLKEHWYYEIYADNEGFAYQYDQPF